MRKLIFTLLLITLLSIGFSSKIDPLLIKEFKSHRTNGISQLGLTEKKLDFIVWYKNSIPEGNVIKKFHNFPVAVFRGSLSDVYRIANDSNTVYIFASRKFRPLLNETVNSTNSIIGDYPQIFSNYNGSGIKIEVIDSGANWSLPFLENVSHETLNITNLNGDHGNAVISEIVSENDSYPGIARGATIYDARIFDSNGYANLSDLLSAIDWGISKNVNIESMSLGYSNGGFGQHSIYLQLLFDQIFGIHNDTLYVIAAGNTPGNFTISQPASSTPMNVIAVGAVYKNGSVWENSSRGPLESNRIKPDVCAPGLIYTFDSNGSLALWEGTSMAAPLVSGAAAIIEQASNHTLSSSEVKLILMEGAENGSVWECGAGTINVSKSLDLLNKTIIVVDDNYLGYVGNYTNLTVRLKNFGNPQWVNLTIYYYNWTIWNTTKVYVNGTNETTFNLKIPNLSWDKSYGWIVLNDSAKLPFSWAKSVIIQPSQFYSRINITNRFYTINYSALPDGLPLPLFIIGYHNNTPSLSWNEITPLDKDLSGFSFNGTNSSETFEIFPFREYQMKDYKFYNLENNSVNVSLFDFSYSIVTNNWFVNQSGIFFIEIGGIDPNDLIVENCTNGCVPMTNGITIIYDEMIPINFKFMVWKDNNTKLNIHSINSQNFTISVFSYVSTETVDRFSSKLLPMADLYVVDKYYPIEYKSYNATVNCSKVVENKFSHLKCNITLPTNTNGTYNFYVYRRGEGLLSNDQYSIVVKEVNIINGKGSVDILLYPYLGTEYCLGNLTITNITECNGIHGYVFSGGNSKASSSEIEGWLSDLVETVSKMLNFYVGG